MARIFYQCQRSPIFQFFSWKLHEIYSKFTLLTKLIKNVFLDRRRKFAVRVHQSSSPLSHKNIAFRYSGKYHDVYIREKKKKNEKRCPKWHLVVDKNFKDFVFSDGSDLQVYSVVTLLRAAPFGSLDYRGCKCHNFVNEYNGHWLQNSNIRYCTKETLYGLLQLTTATTCAFLIAKVFLFDVRVQSLYIGFFL